MRQLVLWCKLILFTCSGISQQAGFQEYLEGFAQSDALKHGLLSATVLEVNGETIAGSYQGQKSLVPASSMKLLSTLTAIEVLGKEMKFETIIAHDGAVLSDGTLEGNLYIVGSGDPTLGSSKFKDYKNLNELVSHIVAGVKAYGIKCISKDIIADASIYPGLPVSASWQWIDLGNYYASGAWGINIHDNLYYVYFGQRAKEGMATELLRYGPEIPGLNLSNEVLTGEAGSGDNAYIYGVPMDYQRVIRGTIPPGSKEFSIKGSIPDPPLFLAYHLRKEFARNNIKVESYRSNYEPTINDKRQEILRISSPPLKDIVKLTNVDSDNLFSEALLKKLNIELDDSPDGEKGIDAIKDYLIEFGVDVRALQIVDGSGLSTSNRFSSFMMADFLKKLAGKHGLNEVCQYLPQAGKEGTVRSLFKNHPASGRAWIKSGSMESVMSYSGYMKAKSDKWYAFCLIINGYEQKNREIRGLLDQCMQAIYERN